MEKVYEIFPDISNSCVCTTVLAYENDLKSAMHLCIDLNFEKFLKHRCVYLTLSKHKDLESWFTESFYDFDDDEGREEEIAYVKLYKDEDSCVFYGDLKPEAYKLIDREIAKANGTNN